MSTAVAISLVPARRTVSSRCRYRTYLAANEEQRAMAYRLRFQVFNLELNEGLQSAYANEMDSDEFDPYCEHLLVEDRTSGQVVGTYRMQSGSRAAANLGYYSEREFDFTPFEDIRQQVLELGRACVHREHRNFDVLSLLWKGIAQYANGVGARYLVGCSSLTSQNPVEGWGVFNRLREYLCDPALQTMPKQEFRLTVNDVVDKKEPPKLLRAYLAIGAKICGPRRSIANLRRSIS